MGESPRLYQILLNEKLEEDEKARKSDEFRGFPGFSTFHKLSKGIRTSFRRIRSIGSKLSRGKTFTSNKDSGYNETEPRAPTTTAEFTAECDSLDSGLESDHSLDLSSSILKERSANQSRDTAGSAADIVRKSSNRSSRTIDSGILSRTSPGCLVTSNRLHNSLPKKKVSIRLPGELSAAASNPPLLFGHHLQVERTRLVDLQPFPDAAEVDQVRTVSRQRHDVMMEARLELTALHPGLWRTIAVLFTAGPGDLAALHTNTIGNLIFDLRTILYESMKTVVHFELTLFLVQHFLLRLSCLLGLDRLPDEFEDLIAKSEKLGYSRQQTFLLTETQTLYIELWCSLLDCFS